MRSLGADDVVNYRSEDWADKVGADRAQIVYDCVGGNAEWQRGRFLFSPQQEVSDGA